MKALLVLIALAACGPSSQQKAIATTYAVVNAAAAGFVAFDAAHQHDLVVHAGNRAAADVALAAWQAEQTKVEMLFAGAYRAIAAAAIAQSSPNMSGMVSAALLVSQELQALGVKL